MADYRPLLIRAISRLNSNTLAGRQSVYANARETLITLLSRQVPQLPEEEAERERHALEEAIRKVEKFEVIVGKTSPTRSSTAASEKDVRTCVIRQGLGKPEPDAFLERNENQYAAFFNAIADPTFDFQNFQHDGASRVE